jgi:formylglycine-generating enzyme
VKYWAIGLAVMLTPAACSKRHQEPATNTSARPPPDGMVLIPRATFMMGTQRGAGYEGPPHPVTVEAFFLDRTEVTNEAFEKFVASAGHVTRAETNKESAVFVPAKQAWTVASDAMWRRPEGAGSTIDTRARHPVVHVAWSDARAFCGWRVSGGRLPTEAEWERAARGDHDRSFPWGDDPALADGGAPANTWQGRFPEHDEAADGFSGTAPVGSFPPTSFGLLDMAGNVWEWVDDVFDPNAYARAARGERPRPTSGKDERVIRGGSWLCGPGHCIGFRVAARGHARAEEPTNHVGFRCAKSS